MSNVIDMRLAELREQHREASHHGAVAGQQCPCGGTIHQFSFGWTGGMTMFQCDRNDQHWAYDLEDLHRKV